MNEPNEYFNTVYDATFRPLMRVCICRARRLCDADDLLQNVYARFYRHVCRHGAGAVQNPLAYLLRILNKELSRYYRRAAWEREAPLESAEDLPDPGEAVEDATLSHLEAEAVWAFVREESDLTQRVFVLYYGYEMRQKEIAEALGLSEAAVKNRLLRTQKKIRSRLSEETES